MQHRSGHDWAWSSMLAVPRLVAMQLFRLLRELLLEDRLLHQELVERLCRHWLVVGKRRQQVVGWPIWPEIRILVGAMQLWSTVCWMLGQISPVAHQTTMPVPCQCHGM